MWPELMSLPVAWPRWLAELCAVRGCLPRCAAEHDSPFASELRASLLQAPERAQRAMQQHVAEQLVGQVEEAHCGWPYVA